MGVMWSFSYVVLTPTANLWTSGRRSSEEILILDCEFCMTWMRKTQKNTPWANTACPQANATVCLSCMLSLMLFQSDSTGKLGFHEFKHLWNNIKKWQASTAGLVHVCDTSVSVLHSLQFCGCCCCAVCLLNGTHLIDCLWNITFNSLSNGS